MNEGDIAKLALRDATDTFDRLVTELVEAAEGDVDTLYRAAISITTPAAPPGTPKHIAFVSGAQGRWQGWLVHIKGKRPILSDYLAPVADDVLEHPGAVSVPPISRSNT